MRYSYGPGSWLTLAHAGAGAIVDPSAPSPAVERIWLAMVAGQPMSVWAQEVSGTSASFGFIHMGVDGVRLLLRGQVSALVGAHRLHGYEGQPWAEHVALDQFDAHLWADGAAVERTYPLTGGVVFGHMLSASNPDGVGSVRIAGASIAQILAAAPTAPDAEIPAQEDSPVQSPPAQSLPVEPGASRQPVLDHISDIEELEHTILGNPFAPPSADPHPSADPPSGAPEPAPAAEPAGFAPDAPEPKAAATSPVEPDVDLPPGIIDSVPSTRRRPDLPAEATIIPGAQPDSAQDDAAGAATSPAPEETILNAVPTGGGDRARGQAAVIVRLWTGDLFQLHSPVLLGRAPEVTATTTAAAPQLVPVHSPNLDISRSHVEIRLEGEHIVVTDLRSTNGTLIQVPGGPARRLHPGEGTPIPVGTMIDLGDGATASVEQDE